jgi:hypothetical protein
MAKKKLEYIYLVWTRESKQLNEPVYKIGKTKQDGLDYLNSYPNGSSLLFHIECNDCTTKENQIKELFNEKYYPATLYGTEYFIGNYRKMKKDMIEITKANIELTDLFDEKTYTELYKKLNEVIEPIPNDKQKILSSENTQSKIQQLIDNKEITLTVNAKLEITNPNIESKIQPTEKKPSKIQQLIDNKEITLSVNTKPKNNNEYKCPHCENVYKTKNGLQKHIRTCHSVVNNINQEKQEKQHICKFCNKNFRTRQTKWSHEQKCKTINQIPLAEQVKNLTAEVKELKANSNPKINIDV